MSTNVIVFLGISVIAVVIAYNILHKSSNTPTPSPNPSPPSPPTPQNKIECGVLDPSTIKTCDINNVNNICDQCDCSSDTNLSGCMTCQKIDENNPYYSQITKDNCLSPFVWDDKKSICKLKDGTYCLPTKILPIQCNTYTGIKVLAKGDSGKGYQWNCVCNDPTKFTGPSCTNIQICGMLGADADKENPYLYVKRGLVNKSDPTQYWRSNSKWDPIKDGMCQCAPDEVYDSIRQACMPNQCGPENSINKQDPKSCDCKVPGMIDCSLISQTYDGLSQYYNGVCKIPSCVPDPCGGRDGKAGHYDKNSKNCVCNPGYDKIIDPSSIVGETCIDYCKDVLNPCGDRGTCYFYETDSTVSYFILSCTQDSTTKQCKEPYTLISLKDKVNSYLSYSIDSKLNISLSISSTGNPFLLIPYCDSNNSNNCPDPTKKASSFNINTVYYLKVIDNKNNEYYVDIINRQILLDKDKSNSLIKLVNNNNVQEKSTSIITQIFSIYNNAYLSVDGSNNIIFIKKDYLNSSRCKDCKPGYKQDSSQLCNIACVGKGNYCNPNDTTSNPCCDGLTCQYDYGIGYAGYFCK